MKTQIPFKKPFWRASVLPFNLHPYLGDLKEVLFMVCKRWDKRTIQIRNIQLVTDSFQGREAYSVNYNYIDQNVITVAVLRIYVERISYEV